MHNRVFPEEYSYEVNAQDSKNFCDKIEMWDTDTMVLDEVGNSLKETLKVRSCESSSLEAWDRIIEEVTSEMRSR